MSQGKTANTFQQSMLIPLTQGKFAIVDEADYKWLSKYKWYAARQGSAYYAQRVKNRKTISMAREILGLLAPASGDASRGSGPKHLYCDHKNHNTLDNRRCNLRIATAAQNQRNRRHQAGCSSKYKGVSWDKAMKKWAASITFKGKKIHLNHYDSEQYAAIAYDDFAIRMFGEFAYLNKNLNCPLLEETLKNSYFFESIGLHVPLFKRGRNTSYDKQAKQTKTIKQNSACCA